MHDNMYYSVYGKFKAYMIIINQIKKYTIYYIVYIFERFTTFILNKIFPKK